MSFQMPVSQSEHLSIEKSKNPVELNEPLVVMAEGHLDEEREDLEFSFAPFWKRFLARIFDTIICLIVFAIFASLATNFYYQTIPNENRDFILNFLEQNATSVEQTQKLVTCDFPNSQKEICLNSQIYLNISNFLGILVLTIGASFYFILFTWKGNTFGKKLFRIKVTSQKGQSITLLQATARETIWIVNGLLMASSYLYRPISAVVPFIWLILVFSGIKILTSLDKTGWQDIIAQTFVLKM